MINYIDLPIKRSKVAKWIKLQLQQQTHSLDILLVVYTRLTLLVKYVENEKWRDKKELDPNENQREHGKAVCVSKWVLSKNM